MKMKKSGMFVVAPLPEKKKNMEMDLEEALDLTGIGKYQFIHCALMLASLSAAILEMIGNAFILPAAACDLNIPDSLKGIITSVPNIGAILTAPLWGSMADSRGRKPALVAACAGAGLFGLLAAFMPTLLTYALCKFLGSLFVACPSSLGFAFACELVPRRHRDRAVLLTNGLLMLSSTLSPLIAWGVLAVDWHLPLGSLLLRPWRLLTAVYAAPLILTAAWMTRADESPKFLMSRGKPQQALEVLTHIFAKNSGRAPEEFCVTSLKPLPEDLISVNDEKGSEAALSHGTDHQSALDLLKPPNLKWLALTGFLMFGLFSLLNGLYLFSADIINKVMVESSQIEGTICTVMNQVSNVTTTDCVDTVSHSMFLIMVVTTLVYGLIVLVASISPISKKTQLVGMFFATGVACIMSVLITDKMVAGAAMSALQITALGVGPLTAYAVHLFPTTLRGTAVGAVLMLGRAGAVAGANTAGYFLAQACAPTFYGFAAFMFLCTALSFLLPGEETPQRATGVSDHVLSITKTENR